MIELDEDAHKSVWAFENDRERDRELVSKGLRVMRVTEAAMDDRLAADIRAALDAATRPLVP